MKLFNAVTGANVVLYRLSGGRLGSGPVLLLEHTDRKSGPRRTTPVLYIQDGDDLVVVGSRVGSDFDPAWWLNLKANPATTVQVRSQRRQVVARQATPEEEGAAVAAPRRRLPRLRGLPAANGARDPGDRAQPGVGAPPLSETSSAADAQRH
jgi:deazaflavin-dependent oxidoreductase (nitroreductase family)